MRVSPANPIAALLPEQIACLRGRHFGRLAFSSVLEQRFEMHTAGARAGRLSNEGWCLSVCYLLVLFGDLLCMPQRWAELLVVRCGLVLPVLLLSTELLRRNPHRLLRECAVVVCAGAVACSSFLLYYNQSPALAAAAEMGVMMSLLVTNVIMRLRFPFALVSTALCIASNAAFLYITPSLSTSEKVGWGVPAGWAALFILMAGYSLEREERLGFLLNLRTEIQADQLAALNVELARLSSMDALTGLANRAGFDERLKLLWDAVAADGSPLSAVLIDVDYFKIVNDTQGHLYGDEVLKRVAALVAQSLRGKSDFAARFGGEEFIVLLPGETLEEAGLIAERIRSLIQLAGSPAPAQNMPQPGLWTTVSCGVATMNDASVQTPRMLLHAADQALYAAKAGGRNRVCCATLPTFERAGVTETVISAWE